MSIANLFPDGLRSFNPCLALHEAHPRELGSLDHARTMLFEDAPVVVKSYLTKPSVVHGSIF
jgi:hypothetical protein